MIYISDKIKKLPKKSLKKWIADRRKEKRSDEWKAELDKLENTLNDTKGTGKKGAKD